MRFIIGFLKFPLVEIFIVINELIELAEVEKAYYIIYSTLVFTVIFSDICYQRNN